MPVRKKTPSTAAVSLCVVQSDLVCWLQNTYLLVDGHGKAFTFANQTITEITWRNRTGGTTKVSFSKPTETGKYQSNGISIEKWYSSFEITACVFF